MQSIYCKIRQLGGSDISFFITGETGVGKEGIARYIHENGPRHGQPFVAVNCGRFTAELLQSELFGHEEGAFTGAHHQRRGAFEAASGGVLFLDEVAEMPLDAQKMMLRVLDTKTFTRLGGNESLTADFYIIAATNRNIGQAVLEEEFRPDLYYRLMGMMLDVPALRERQEDIPPLVETFITEFNSRYGKDIKGITPEALTHLKQAAWPGNIRQLRTTVRTAIALATTDTLEVKDFPYNFFSVPGLEKPFSAPEIKENTSTFPEFVQVLISIWKTFPSETQQTLIHELSKHLPEFWRNFQTDHIATTDENAELLNIKDMDQHEILRAVAQRRIDAYVSINKAARSLGIDTRTLQKHAHWEEQNDASE